MNETAVDASTIHGTNPQYLIEKITRSKIYQCIYWKEKCFGLTAETLLDRAITIKYYGGCYGGTLKPSPFLCLVLKLLQLQPEKEIIIEFIRNDDFKYLRALGAFYLRLVGKAEDVYRYLEPLYNDYRKLVFRGLGSGTSGWQIKHMDEFIDELLTKELVCDIALPFLQKRGKLEELGQLQPRKSILDEEIEFMQNQEEDDDDGQLVDDDDDDDDNNNNNNVTSNSANIEKDLNIVASENILGEIKKSIIKENVKYDNGNTNDIRHDDGRRRDDYKSKYDHHYDNNKDKPSIKDRETDFSRKEDINTSRRSRSRDRDERERRRSRSRDRGDRDRDRDRERRRSRSRDRGDRDRERERRRSRSRDRGDRDRRRSRSRDRSDRDRRRSRSRDRGDCDRDRERRRSRSRDRNKQSGRRSRSNSESRGDKNDRPNKAFIDFDDKEIEDEQINELKSKEVEKANKKAAKKFDKIFGKKDNTVQSSSKAEQGKVEEGSVEYWNQIRASLGIKALRE